MLYDAEPYVEPLSVVALSPDGNYLAAGFSNGGAEAITGQDGVLRAIPNPWPVPPIYVWPLANGIPSGQPKQLCGPQGQGVLNMVWTRDSQAIIFTDGYGSTIMCPLSGATGKLLFNDHATSIEVPALSPDGTKLAIGADNQITIVSLKH